MVADVLQEALQGLPLGPVRYFSSLASTNDEAVSWAAAGAPHLALVVADEQTAGKGRSGRRWLTPPGSALAFSLVLQPRHFPEAVEKPGALPDAGTLEYGYDIPQWVLSRLTALGTLAVSSALQATLGLASQIKWPNDVLLEGKKVAGVLAEVQWQGEQLASAILGIGINVAKDSIVSNHPYGFPPTSIETVLEKPVDRWHLLAATLESLLHWLPRLASKAFLTSWQERLAYRGERVRILRDAAAPLDGRLVGLGRDGALILVTEDGHRLALQSGEVHLRSVVSGLC